MANEEHTARLKEGASVWNAWRESYEGEIDLRGADLRGADLREINLQEVTLEEAVLSGANLEGADLRAANLWRANLQEANLGGANLQEAMLWKVDLQNAILEGTNFQKTNLMGADLRGANLWRANLQEANLREANLQEANLMESQLHKVDLRQAKEIRFDDTNILGIRFDLSFGRILERFWNPFFVKNPEAIPWIELRREYTGINFLLTILFLISFLIPYMFQAVYFQGLNWFQETIVTTLPEVKESIESIELTVPTIDPEGLIITYFDSVTPCFAETCESHYVLWMILGLNQGVFLVMFNLILIVYNGLRFYVTQEVNVLRDEEEMAGWSPKKNKIERLIDLHIIIKSLWFLSVLSGALNLGVHLFNTVQVPA